MVPVTALHMLDTFATTIRYCDKTCSLALARNRNFLFHIFND